MARILLLTPQWPYPPLQGTSLRNFHNLRALAQSHDVTLLSYAESDQQVNGDRLSELARLLPPVPVPGRTTARRSGQLVTERTPDLALRLRSEAFEHALVGALEGGAFDAVQIEGIELARAIDTVRKASSTTRVVLDCHNAETELQRRSLAGDRRQPPRWPAALYSAIQVSRLQRFERWALRAADGVIAVSEEDRHHLQVLAGDGRPITVIPNTVAVADYQWAGLVPEEARFDIVFTGKMDYRPNVDGVLWFAEAIWPLIRQQRPQTTWGIVGQRPHSRLDALRRYPGIVLTGRVAEVQPYLAGAGVYILPLRIGSGTRLKLIESMASGCAIVSTSLGAEGIAVQHGRELLLADTPGSFAEAILDLLDDPARRQAIGERARIFAARYDWQAIAGAFEQFYAELLSPNR